MDLSIPTVICFIVWHNIGLLWSLVSLLTQPLGWKLCHTTQQSDVTKLVKTCFENKTINTINANERYTGWYFSWTCVAYFNNVVSERNGTSTHAYFLIKNPDSIFKNNCGNDKSEKKQEIKLYEKTSGCYFDTSFKNRTFNMPYEPTQKQNDNIAIICNVYNKSNTNSCVIVLHGKPGTQKTLTGIFVAKKLGACLCRDFEPTEPNNMLASIYNICMPTKEKPLVIMFDEFECMIDKIFSPTVQTPQEMFMTQITSKSTWNKFFDNINIGLYPYLIIIMTTNRSLDEIDKKDPSLLRDGRVNLRMEI